MSPYIENLTNHLIAKNGYDRFVQCSGEKFFEHIKGDLEVGDVRKMKPETLGKIMASFEVGDVMASKAELFQHSHFAGDCGDFLRELTATCLAFAITHRFADDRMPGVPFHTLRPAEATLD